MKYTKQEHEILDKWLKICGRIIGTYYDNYKGHHYPRNILEVLMYLHNDENVCEPAAIADKLSVPRQTMTSLIDTMVKKDLVTRKPHKSDRRRIQIIITEKGREVAKEFRNKIIERYQLFMDNRKQKDVLEKLTAALSLIEDMHSEV